MPIYKLTKPRLPEGAVSAPPDSAEVLSQVGNPALPLGPLRGFTLPTIRGGIAVLADGDWHTEGQVEQAMVDASRRAGSELGKEYLLKPGTIERRMADMVEHGLWQSRYPRLIRHTCFGMAGHVLVIGQLPGQVSAKHREIRAAALRELHLLRGGARTRRGTRTGR